MMKHLRLYPLIFALMTAAILGCMVRIGWMLYALRDSRVYADAQLVWEVNDFAAV